ncbi:hypothetical protein LTR78_010419 [Recurvomyces mirabilis]|uniref:Superoxide dismutase n=1 Tax=Recurvomyces mirabilis TaxID=574656 RepID=A0AAE0WGV7_9PEZI|nr:hypothetical protein LTR78_010419 [Recurvomyces mirabilis]KAK5150497.1 hypothetical protein LTS14_009990 [Recurvomyces mirabilis]
MPTYHLPTLPYPYDALEPHFDEETMRIHHTKHHQTYITNLNNLLSDQPTLNTLSVEEVVAKLSHLPAEKRKGVRNHGGGHANHSFFWRNLTPSSTNSTLSGELKVAIESTFGSVDAFQQVFEKAATTVFGSGWAWLILSPEGELRVVTTANQDSPLMGESIAGPGTEGRPILALDVWEHAYYLRYRNVRPDYIKAYWSVVSWDFAAEQFALAKGQLEAAL